MFLPNPFMVSVYSPHSPSLTKFLSPPGSRDLPSGPPGSQPLESLRSAPSPAAARGVFPAPALPSGVWVSAPCRAGSRLPGGRPGQAGRQGGPAVGVRPGPCAPLLGSHPAATLSRSLPGERWRLPRRLRFGLRARGRAPETGGDSGNVTGAMRPGRSLLSPEIRAAGPRPGRTAAVVVAARPGGPARRGAPSARGHRRGS